MGSGGTLVSVFDQPPETSQEAGSGGLFLSGRVYDWRVVSQTNQRIEAAGQPADVESYSGGSAGVAGDGCEGQSKFRRREGSHPSGARPETATATLGSVQVGKDRSSRPGVLWALSRNGSYHLPIAAPGRGVDLGPGQTWSRARPSVNRTDRDQQTVGPKPPPGKYVAPRIPGSGPLGLGATRSTRTAASNESCENPRPYGCRCARGAQSPGRGTVVTGRVPAGQPRLAELAPSNSATSSSDPGWRPWRGPTECGPRRCP